MHLLHAIKQVLVIIHSKKMFFTQQFISSADFNLDFYLEVQNLKYLVRTMGDSPFNKRYRCVICFLIDSIFFGATLQLQFYEKRNFLFLTFK